MHVAIQTSLSSQEISSSTHSGTHEVGGTLPESAVSCCMERRLAGFPYTTGSSGLNKGPVRTEHWDRGHVAKSRA